MEDETVPERVEVEMLKVRGKVPFPFGRVRNVLVRSTNWIGDVVMTFPAIAAVRKTMPEARITALAKPWVAELLRLCPDVDEVMLFQSPGTHDGLSGKLRLAAELRARRFDAAILLQNAIEAAIIARLARIPVRAGYDSDCRRLLLTHSVGRTREIRKVHQIDYYLEMIKALGFVSAGRDVRLNLGDDYRRPAKTSSSVTESAEAGYWSGWPPARPMVRLRGGIPTGSPGYPTGSTKNSTGKPCCSGVKRTTPWRKK
jgi:heptosyltransferase-2